MLVFEEFSHRPHRREGELFGSRYLLFIALVCVVVPWGRLAGQVPSSVGTTDTRADAAATLAKVTALRDAFVQKINAAGRTCPFAPPAIVMGDVPSFGRYEGSTNTLQTSEWSKLSADGRALFFRAAGAGATEETARAVFEEGTHRWVFVHEMGHWWQACNKAIEGRSHYQVEFGANRIALAYWRETDPGFAEKMIAQFQGRLERAPNPVPEGQPVNKYFDENYGALGPTPAYRWFQYRMTGTAAAESPHPTFAQTLAMPSD
jgi:hypothetical protein